MKSSTPNRFSLLFQEPALEQAYRDAEDVKALRLMRIGLKVGVAVSVGASACLLALLMANLAQSVLPAGLSHGMATRQVFLSMVTYALGSAVCFGLTFTANFKKHPQSALSALCVVASAALAYWVSTLPSDFVAQRGFMFLVVHLFTVYGLLRMRLLPAIATGWLSMVAFLLVLRITTDMDAASVARQLFWLVICNIWGMFICHQIEWALRREFVAGQERDQAHARAEKLLCNILPAAIANKLKATPGTLAEQVESATVLFADIVGFTQLAARKSPVELVALLDQVFTQFDQLALQHGLEKIKTIGDAYMAVAGLPEPQVDHALRAARMALSMVETVQRLAIESGEDIRIRIGLNSGPVIAGVIGKSKFSYDLWGDTVNLASRLESLGEPGHVHCSAQTATLVASHMNVTARGKVDVKGKGAIDAYYISHPS